MNLKKAAGRVWNAVSVGLAIGAMEATPPNMPKQLQDQYKSAFTARREEERRQLKSLTNLAIRQKTSASLSKAEAKKLRGK